MSDRVKPPPRTCADCKGEDHDGQRVLIAPEPCIIKLSHDYPLPAWRFTCRLCGSVREEPAR